MDRQTALHFIRHTEMAISPKAIGGLYGRAEMLRKLPIGVQKWVVGRAGGQATDISFVVEPYSYFLAYEIEDASRASTQLPPGYRLVPTAMFAGTAPRFAGILAAFNVHTSVFWGTRVEFYLIAEHEATGMLSWIICDYESNTISYDPRRGFSGSSTSQCVVTTSYAGDLIVDVRGEDGRNHVASVAGLHAASPQPLDQRLWLEGNLSVDYGGRLRDGDSVPFGLIFDPGEVERALHIPLGSVEIERNTFGQELLASGPFEACCFPFAQHFRTTSFPTTSPIRDRAGLEAAVRRLDTEPA